MSLVVFKQTIPVGIWTVQGSIYFLSRQSAFRFCPNWFARLLVKKIVTLPARMWSDKKGILGTLFQNKMFRGI